MPTKKIKRAFRPSLFPRYEACIHYEPDEIQTPYSARGTDLHAVCAQVLKASVKGAESAERELRQIKDRETRDTVEWTWRQLCSERPILVNDVEVPLKLIIGKETVWEPTADGYGFDDGEELWGWDLKSGDERDYSAQYAAYGALLMKKAKRKKMLWAEVLLDLRKVNEFEMDYDDCLSRVKSLWADFENPAKLPYSINDYCGQCAGRPRCPLWIAEANHAITFPIKDESSIAQLKKDPIKLGQFYVAWKRLNNLVEDWKLKEAIFEFLQNGTEVPGTHLVRDSSWTVCDTEKVLQEIVKQVGTMRAVRFIDVSVSRMREVWAEYTKEPFPEQLIGLQTFTPDTRHVAVKATTPGRGRAAAARKRRLQDGH